MLGKVHIESWVCTALSVTVHRITVQILIAAATVQLLKWSKNERRQTKNIWWVYYVIQLMNKCVSWWSAEGHFRGQWSVTIIQQLRHLGPFTDPLSSSPSVDHGLTGISALLPNLRHIRRIYGQLVDSGHCSANFWPLGPALNRLRCNFVPRPKDCNRDRCQGRLAPVVKVH